MIKTYLSCALFTYSKELPDRILPEASGSNKTVEGEVAQVPIGIALSQDDSVCMNVMIGVPCDATDEEKDQ